MMMTEESIQHPKSTIVKYEDIADSAFYEMREKLLKSNLLVEYDGRLYRAIHEREPQIGTYVLMKEEYSYRVDIGVVARAKANIYVGACLHARSLYWGSKFGLLVSNDIGGFLGLVEVIRIKQSVVVDT